MSPALFYSELVALFISGLNVSIVSGSMPFYIEIVFFIVRWCPLAKLLIPFTVICLSSSLLSANLLTSNVLTSCFEDLNIGWDL